MPPIDDDFTHFVEHPRFGRGPRYTGLNPLQNTNDVYFHWHSSESCRVPNTAIGAGPSRQQKATVPVTHYFDVKRTCADCGKPFLFFAEEQRHWYEELGFSINSDCIRCVPCRKIQQGIERHRQRYEDLFHLADRNREESLDMAESCLVLIEESVFSPRSTEMARRLLNEADPLTKNPLPYDRASQLRARVEAIEANASRQ